MFNFKIKKLWHVVVVVAVAAFVDIECAAVEFVSKDLDMKCLSPILIKNPRPSIYSPSDRIQVPCGKCIPCLRNKIRSFSFRLSNEMRSSQTCYFVTFTYSTENLYVDRFTGEPQCCKRDLQLFFKRLRKRYPHSNIKYFAVSEYGDEFGRPHYHAIIFNIPIIDKPVVIFQHGKRRIVYPVVKRVLDEIWQLGYTDVGEANFATCQYCCKYIYKQFLLAAGHPVSDDMFVLRSKGIGLSYLNNHYDKLINSTSITWNGYLLPIPRYYINKIFYNENKQPYINLLCRRYFLLKSSFSPRGYDPYGVEYFENDRQWYNGEILLRQSQLEQVNNYLRGIGGDLRYRKGI